MLVLGTALAIPASLLAAYAPTDTILFVARLLGGLAAGMAYPTTLALITALWSGPGRTKSIALWSALGGAISALGPLLSGSAVGALLVGVGLPAHAAAGRRRPGPGDPARAGPRERDDGSGRQPGRHPLGPADRGASCSRSTSRRSRTKGALVLGLVAIAVAAGVAFIIRQRRARNPLYDLARRGSADLLGRGVRRHHRVRHADGRDVRRAAVPPERARLRHARRRDGDPARGVLHGA